MIDLAAFGGHVAAVVDALAVSDLDGDAGAASEEALPDADIEEC